MVQEHTGAAAVSNYVGAQGVYAREDGEELTHLLKNGHGDVVAKVTDGAVTGTYTYDAFGNEKAPDAADTNPFRYCGEYMDAESGSVYLRNRYYAPSIGRFTQEDPIQDGGNWYVYAGNNPVRFNDILGLHRQPVTETIDGQTVTTAEREDIRVLTRETNGVLKVEGDTVKIKALGGYAEISISAYNDGVHLIDDHLHFTYGEFFELLGLEYEKTAITVQVTQGEENMNRLTYAAKEMGVELAGKALIKPIQSIWGGFGAIFGNLTGFMEDLTTNTEASPPIVPQGSYQINRYTVSGKVILQQQIGVSSGNNYYSVDYEYWNPENPYYFAEMFNGWQMP